MNIYIGLAIYVVLTGFLMIDWNLVQDYGKGCVFKNESILFLIAHPDDETMFFGPTLINLTETETIYVMCLTTGDFEKEGKTRQSELIKALAQFNIPAENILIIDDPDIKDGTDQQWNINLTTSIVNSAVESYNISKIITFDEYGVSGHPNHQDTYKAIKLLNRSKKFIDIHVLESVNIVRKYLSFTEIATTLIEMVFHTKDEMKTKCLITVGPKGYFSLIRSLYCHESQMLWFRRLYSLFSRYMFINVLIKV